MRKLIYSTVAASVVFAAQPASADSTQFWNENTRQYHGVADLPFPSVNPGADLARTVVAPGSAPQRSANTQADSAAWERARAERDAAPAPQLN